MTWSELMHLPIASFTLGDIIVALLIAVGGFYLCKLVMRILSRIIDKSSIDPTLGGFVKVALKIILYFALIVIVLGCLGISAVSLVAVFSVCGLALSLAAEDSLSNLAGGISLLATRPFQVGDFVDAGGKSGTVKSIGLVHTHLTSVDNKDYYIPNSTVISGEITNYSREELRRVDMTFGASYDCPVQKVVEVLKDVVAGTELVVNEPEPFVNVSEFDDSSINYVVRVWVKNADYWTVHFDLLNRVKDAFDKNGIEIPYNKLDVHVIQK